jgi:hypothetical protein
MISDGLRLTKALELDQRMYVHCIIFVKLCISKSVGLATDQVIFWHKGKS